MQIYGLDAHGKLIHALQAERQKSYQCPECSGLVRVRGGRFKHHHFYHVAHSACRLHGKSAVHLHIQLILQKMFTSETIHLEHRFPEIGRIADVVWMNQKLIIEIQVSPISAEEVAARNRDYNSIGYQVIWILHDRQFNRAQLSFAERHLRSSTHYFTNINRFGNGFFYDQYAEIHFKKRIRRSPRLSVDLTQFVFVNSKQLPRHFPQERKKWAFSFKGDLFHHPYAWEPTKRKRIRFFYPTQIYRILLHHLLERFTK